MAGQSDQWKDVLKTHTNFFSATIVEKEDADTLQYTHLSFKLFVVFVTSMRGCAKIVSLSP